MVRLNTSHHMTREQLVAVGLITRRSGSNPPPQPFKQRIQIKLNTLFLFLWSVYYRGRRNVKRKEAKELCLEAKYALSPAEPRRQVPDQEFSKAGARVAFVDVNNQAGKENEEYIKRNGGQVIFFHGDISEEKTLRSLQI